MSMPSIASPLLIYQNHTVICLLRYREFTVNMISNWFIEAANFTSGSFEPGVDEVEMSGLTPIPSVRVCFAHHASMCSIVANFLSFAGLEPKFGLHKWSSLGTSDTQILLYRSSPQESKSQPCNWSVSSSTSMTQLMREYTNIGWLM